MKVPKYEKDRTLTRRTVKGAAGGMKGVDYEDDRRPDPAKKLRADALRLQKLKSEHLRAARNEAAGAARVASGGAETEKARSAAPKEEQEMILDDEDATSRDTKARQKRRPVVARDRFTVDKNAPDRRRKIRWDLLSEEDDEEDLEQDVDELDFAAIAEAVFGRPDGSTFRAHLYGDLDNASPGAPGLLMPDDIQAAFGSPLDYAKHCMLLAESFAHSTGAHRHETVRYLAALFLGLSDVRFGRRALLAWGPDTGILDIYPLEVVEQVLTLEPTFLPKVRFGRWVAPELGEAPQSDLTVSADLPFLLTVPEDVTVRGFAIKGGARPGYCFEPGPDLTTYALTLGLPGHYELLMSARDGTGDTLVDRLRIRVPGTPPPEPPLPTRDPNRVAAWPMPQIPDRRSAPAENGEQTAATPVGLDPHEVARRRQLDAMMGPKGEEADPIFAAGRNTAQAPLRSGAEAKHQPMLPLEAPEDAFLSAAEAAVLRLALAAGATMADLRLAGVEPADSDEVTEVLPIWPSTTVEAKYDAPAAAAAMAELAERARADAPPPKLGTAVTDEFADAAAPEAGGVEPPPAAKTEPPVIPAPFALTGDEIAAGPPTLPEVPAVDSTLDVPAAQTVPDAPAVVGRPTAVVSGTQARIPGEGGPTARIDLVADLLVVEDVADADEPRDDPDEG